MLAFKPGLSLSDSLPTPSADQQKITKIVTPAPAPEKKIASVVAHVEPPSQPVPQSGLAEWRDILPKLELSGMAYALASNCTLEKITGNKVELALSANHEAMLNQKLKERIAEALGRCLKQTIQLEITITSAELATPLKQHQQEREQRPRQCDTHHVARSTCKKIN